MRRFDGLKDPSLQFSSAKAVFPAPRAASRLDEMQEKLPVSFRPQKGRHADSRNGQARGIH
jgi:hypothetical protein